MNVKIEEIEKNTVKLEIEVGADVLENGLEQSYKKIAKRFNIPGFRKGRAPRSIVERYYGVEVLYEGAVEAIWPEYYSKAVSENNIEPVDSPELYIVELERGKPLIFTATVAVKPEVKLGEYIGLEAEFKQALITDDDVENEIKDVADKNARLVPIEDRVSQIGDTLQIDFEGFIDGVQFENGKGEKYNLELGSNSFINGFEEQLTGKTAGESATVNVRFPDDYASSDLKGKDAVFEVVVHSIKKKELPEIDDEFAQDVSEFDTLDEYKADVRKKLTERGEEQSKANFENELITKIVGDAEIDIPEPMIQRQIEQNMKDLEMRLMYQGLDLDRYYEMSATPKETVDANIRKNSISELKTRLVFEQIIKEKELEITDEEYDNEIRKRAETYKKDYDEYKTQVSEELENYIRSKMMTDKVVALISENAKRV